MLTFDAVFAAEPLPRAFSGRTAANDAITFALALSPLVGLAGAAVDYSRANTITANAVRRQFTALMMSMIVATMNASRMQTPADTYFTAIFTRKDATLLKVTASYADHRLHIIVTGERHHAHRLHGRDRLHHHPVTSSTTAMGLTRLRVALVLDNTGSMASSEIVALQTATTNLLTQLQNASPTPATCTYRSYRS